MGNCLFVKKKYHKLQKVNENDGVVVFVGDSKSQLFHYREGCSNSRSRMKLVDALNSGKIECHKCNTSSIISILPSVVKKGDKITVCGHNLHSQLHWYISWLNPSNITVEKEIYIESNNNHDSSNGAIAEFFLPYYCPSGYITLTVTDYKNEIIDEKRFFHTC